LRFFTSRANLFSFPSSDVFPSCRGLLLLELYVILGVIHYGRPLKRGLEMFQLLTFRLTCHNWRRWTEKFVLFSWRLKRRCPCTMRLFKHFPISLRLVGSVKDTRRLACILISTLGRGMLSLNHSRVSSTTSASDHQCSFLPFLLLYR
jgi:hypothetical protein